MSVFFIKIGLIAVGTEQDVRHPVRRSAHLLTNHIQVNIRTAFDNQLIMNMTDDEAVPESLHGLKIRACDHFGKQNVSRRSSDLPEKALNCMKKENLVVLRPPFSEPHREAVTMSGPSSIRPNSPRGGDLFCPRSRSFNGATRGGEGVTLEESSEIW